MKKRIGIMGGTFDPIHYGHLVTAEEVRVKFGLTDVFFVPSGNPPHKLDREVTHPEHRYLMTVLATVTNLFFSVSRIEIDREGPSYAIDTIAQFKSFAGEDVDLYFITGADAFLSMDKWYKADELLKMCNFVAATRPGYPIEKLDTRFSRFIEIVEVPALSISSTDIRGRVKEGRSIKYLLPEAVEDYIFKNGLYRD